MQTKKIEYGGFMPQHDPEKMEVIERIKALKRGDLSSLGYIKPKKPKKTFMEILFNIITWIWMIVCSIFIGLFAIIIMIIVWLLALSPIWIPCLTIYLIFK